MYRIWTVWQFAAGLGAVEISIAILIAFRPWSRKGSAIGSAVAVGAVGQFLIKDVILLGAAIWSLGEALTDKETPIANRR
jgi:uncharacterized membrane protein YkgB